MSPRLTRFGIASAGGLVAASMLLYERTRKDGFLLLAGFAAVAGVLSLLYTAAREWDGGERSPKVPTVLAAIVLSGVVLWTILLIYNSYGS